MARKPLTRLIVPTECADGTFVTVCSHYKMGFGITVCEPNEINFHYYDSYIDPIRNTWKRALEMRRTTIQKHGGIAA